MEDEERFPGKVTLSMSSVPAHHQSMALQQVLAVSIPVAVLFGQNALELNSDLKFNSKLMSQTHFKHLC